MKLHRSFSGLASAVTRAPAASFTFVMGLLLFGLAWEHLLRDWEDDWSLAIFAAGSALCLVSSSALWAVKSSRASALLLLREKEDRLRASEERARELSEAVEHSSAAVVITDSGGKIEYVNAKFAQITGYSFEEAVGQTPSILKSGRTPRETYQRLWSTITAGEDWKGEFCNRRKSGELYWVAASISPIKDPDGKPTHFVSVEDDVTALKETEEALRRAKEAAEAANRAKSEFLASMSHEIRTPMNAIIGMADLLWETSLDQDQRKYVQVFRSAGETLLNLINDILDLSKVEAGQITLEEMEFDPHEAVEKTCEVMAARAHGKGLELACRVMPDVPANLVGDVARLRQVLTNLVGNAVKFTERGEVILEVRLEEVRLRQAAAGPRGPGECTLLFSVQDTGIGIPRDKLEAVFERFTQADSSTSRKYGGTGLGLAISRRLVELMGGRIWVESEAGRGSTFFFTARFKVSGQPARGVAPLPVDLRGLKALVVDDNAISRLILREVLSAWGAVVTEAEDGERAVAEARRAEESGEPYRLVLLDRRMPGMDGFQVAERVGRSPHPAGATLMMLASDDWSGDAARCREMGIASYLVKPVKRSELHAALVAALGRTAAAVADQSAAGRPDAAAGGLPLRILLVEDSQDNRLLIHAYFKRSPHQVEVAENGEVAVEKFKAGGYDLVLMDMEMPVMDGYAATRAIREWERERGLRPTPVVALTAYALLDEMQRSLDAGCSAHLTKPIKRESLMEAVHRHAGLLTP